MFAEDKGGKCLSNEYINQETKLIWQCEYKHIWKANYRHIKRGHWCHQCAGNVKITINDCINLAISNNGRCLSKTIKNNAEKLKWECANKHQWKAPFASIKNVGSWCPYCSHSISRQQKEIHEYLNKVFPQLQIILNDTQTIKPMHLDIYIPELKIGIEYDGEYWHYSEWAIKNGSLERMNRKNKICKDKYIILLHIREKNWNKDKEEELNKIINKIIRKYEKYIKPTK